MPRKITVGQLNNDGTTIFEVLILLVVGAVFVIFVVLPMRTKGLRGPRRDQCVDNLRKIGLAFEAFASDHDGKYPWNAPVANGGFRLPPSGVGAAEFNNPFFLFKTLSNYSINPKTLICPGDFHRSAAASWTSGMSRDDRASAMTSYFIGTSVDKKQRDGFLSGDRNLLILSVGLDFKNAGNYNMIRTVRQSDLALTNSGNIRWNTDFHGNGGNILLGDGSVQMLSDDRLRQFLYQAWAERETNFDLFLPAL
jgi:prepilin-type processing-associated H-X9-DG protein